ncbi:DNA mismatch repair protein [Dinochytrium kinnereticum]|nr:DNA mismatch repair protein [Dinochytrium kinnereticum]
MDSIRKVIEPLALACPSVSISLIDIGSGARILSTRKTTSNLETFKQLYGMAHAKNLEAVEYKTDLLQISGFMSTLWFPSKDPVADPQQSSSTWKSMIEAGASVSEESDPPTPFATYMPDYELVTKARAGNSRPTPWQDGNLELKEEKVPSSKKRKLDSIISGHLKLNPISGNTQKKSTRVTMSQMSKSGEEKSLWAESLLKNWKNPVFDTSANIGGPNSITSNGVMNRFEFDIEASFGIASHPIASHKIFKGDLEKTRIIGQVDKKFIAAAFKRDDNVGLLLIDQHAADERVKLETLTSELFSSIDGNGDDLPSVRRITSVVTLNPPLKIDVTEREASMAFSLRGAFSRWGIGIGDVERRPHSFDAEDDGRVILPISILPQLIADRCIGNADILKATVLEYLHSADPNSATAAETQCPKGIISILNSKACRSAVMFGDALTKSECQEITGNLKHCSFPFQCAHGRPSMSLVMFKNNRAIDRGIYRKHRVQLEGIHRLSINST